jgi:hypothetical protein
LKPAAALMRLCGKAEEAFAADYLLMNADRKAAANFANQHESEADLIIRVFQVDTSTQETFLAHKLQSSRYLGYKGRVPKWNADETICVMRLHCNGEHLQFLSTNPIHYSFPIGRTSGGTDDRAYSGCDIADIFGIFRITHFRHVPGQKSGQ